MSESKASNVARNLIRIHSIITRSLNVAIENSDSFAKRGFTDESTREGYLNLDSTRIVARTIRFRAN